MLAGGHVSSTTHAQTRRQLRRRRRRGEESPTKRGRHQVNWASGRMGSMYGRLPRRSMANCNTMASRGPAGQFGRCMQFDRGTRFDSERRTSASASPAATGLGASDLRPNSRVCQRCCYLSNNPRRHRPFSGQSLSPCALSLPPALWITHSLLRLRQTAPLLSSSVGARP